MNKINALNLKLIQNKNKQCSEGDLTKQKQDNQSKIIIFGKIRTGPFSSVFKGRIIQTGKHIAVKKTVIKQDQ